MASDVHSGDELDGEEDASLTESEAYLQLQSKSFVFEAKRIAETRFDAPISSIKDEWLRKSLLEAESKLNNGTDKLALVAEDLVFIVQQFQDRSPRAVNPLKTIRGSLYEYSGKFGDENIPRAMLEGVGDKQTLIHYLTALSREALEAKLVANRALFLSLLNPIGSVQYYAMARRVKTIFNPRNGSFAFQAEEGHKFEPEQVQSAFVFAVNAAVRMEALGFVNLRPVTERAYIARDPDEG